MTVRILVGDVRERIADLPDNSVHCVVTSPPYFGLRDYGTAQWDGGDPACDHVEIASGMSERNTLGHNGNLPQTNSANVGRVRQFAHQCGTCGAVRIDSQIGLEPTLAAYIATMVDVFREVRRVLRPDGTCWLNIGDSYAGSGRGPTGINGIGKHEDRQGFHSPSVVISGGLKPKDLMMVPARLAIALCDDGWYLRSDIIWHKRAPMPESVTDRPTSAHEHIFLLTKQPKYFYDATAVAETVTESSIDRLSQPTLAQQEGSYRANGGIKSNGTMKAVGSLTSRNQRNVWTLSPESFAQAHFATFPTEIPRCAIKAGTSEKGACSACGSPWRRQISVRYEKNRPSAGNDPRSRNEDRLADSRELFGSNGWQGNNLRRESETTGWEPSCACDADIVPCHVLDIFGGAGTTGLVADELGRDCTLIELNRDYAEMARSRIYGAAPMFAAVEVA